MLKSLAVCFISFFLAFPVLASDEAVPLSGGYGLLNAPASPRASVILLPGGNGYMGIAEDGSFTGLARNQLVRTRMAYNSYGVATLTLDSGVSLSSAIEFMRERYRRPVVVVGTSRGTLRVPEALASNPAGLVLTSGFLSDVRTRIGAAEVLPPTLVVHHRKDGCRLTTPAAVDPFKAWGGQRVKVVWIDGGRDDGDPCQAGGYHGFAGLDGQVVSVIAAFAKSVR